MKKLINVLLNNKNYKNPPIWIMRQAGRYLPEYLEIRSKIDNFLDLCYNPKLASEVTLQPIKRFNFDAAIIFSDILTVVDAIGIKVEFLKSHGPKISNFNPEFDLSKLKLNNIKNHLQPVFEAISLTKSKLPNDKSLIGFSGAPWTLASYIIEGGGSKNFEKTRKFAIKNQLLFKELIDILTKSIIEYLFYQIEAGADIIKIFDSWAGILPEFEFLEWVIKPNKEIVNNIKEKYPNIPIICFARNSGTMLTDFAENVNCQGLAIDQNFSRKWIIDNIQNNSNKVIQGNLDNYLLAFGSQENIKKEVDDILEKFNKKPFIFNLGHGILPETPIKNVEFLMKLINDN